MTLRQIIEELQRIEKEYGSIEVFIPDSKDEIPLLKKISVRQYVGSDDIWRNYIQLM